MMTVEYVVGGERKEMVVTRSSGRLMNEGKLWFFV
jgi:hypothetical protein